METIHEAIARITKKEVGLSISDIDRFHYLTTTQHIYSNNFIDDTFETHYVTTSFTIELTDKEATDAKAADD